ncbi:Serine proteinase stubble [Nymphon striatum]|nr:Serine proteinase stubble [Nymphon striatum]
MDQQDALLEESLHHMHVIHGCVSINDILLRIGEYDTSHNNEKYNHEERTVKFVIQHQLFDPRTYEYDLALIRLSERVEFRRNIVPVCLPKPEHTFIGEEGTVAGWGRLYEGGPPPSIIHEVKVPVIKNRECEAMYLRAGYREYIPDIFLCAGFEKGGKDSCEGDSGGPLVIKKDGRYTISGIISWGIGCAAKNQPGSCNMQLIFDHFQVLEIRFESV